MSEVFRRLEGAVSDLRVSAGHQEFLQDRQRQLGTAVAAGLAASGLAGAAVGAAVSSTGPGDSVEFFSCHIGNMPVAGAFSKVTFKDGDVVVVAAEPVQGGGLVARAVHAPAASMLWIEPHCSRGPAAHLTQSIKVGWWVFLAFALVSVPLLWMTSGDDPKSFDRVLFFGMVNASVAVIAGAYYTVRFYFQWREPARRAEEIFRCLGFSRPASVNLPRENVRFSRALGVPWPYNTDGPWIYRMEIPGS